MINIHEVDIEEFLMIENKIVKTRVKMGILAAERKRQRVKDNRIEEINKKMDYLEAQLKHYEKERDALMLSEY